MKIKIVGQIGACLRLSRLWGLVAILSLLSVGSQASTALDLAYTIAPQGTPLVRVYDDGARTYLVFAEKSVTIATLEEALAVKAIRGGKTYFASLNLSTDYPSVIGTYDEIVLTVGGQKATITYVGAARQTTAGEKPVKQQMQVVGAGERLAKRNPPAEHRSLARANTAPIPSRVPLANPVPAKSAPPASQSSTENKEMLPDNKVVTVMAPSLDLPPEAPAIGAMAERAAIDPGPGKDAAADEDLIEYKVLVPFAMGKTSLEKDGEKAMDEIIQIGPIAKEIRIRVPDDPGSNFQRAHRRGAEIRKLLIEAGLVHQRISIEAIDAVPDGQIVRAEVALVIDLGKAPKSPN